jgi:hypothetical protein
VEGSPAYPGALGSGHARYAVRTQAADVPLLPGGPPSEKVLAKSCDFSLTWIYVARTQRVRSNYAEKMGRGMAHTSD